MTTKQALKLTQSEWLAVEHRLSVPDCIAQVFAEEGEYAEEDVYNVADLLSRGKWKEANEINGLLVRDVLVEAIEGSTYYGATVPDESPQRQAAAYRVVEHAAEKIAKHYVIESIRVPRC